MTAKEVKLLLAFVLCAPLLLSCRKAKPPAPPLVLSEISGAALWNRIEKVESYDDYPQWPGLEGLRRGQSPHGRYHQIYVNRILFDALPVADRKAPVGSIIVKENFDADKQKTNYTVMAKVQGFDPEHSDWFWAMFGTQGEVVSEGKVDLCISCHQGKSDNDYVIVHPLDAPLGPGGR